MAGREAAENPEEMMDMAERESGGRGRGCE